MAKSGYDLNSKDINQFSKPIFLSKLLFRLSILPLASLLFFDDFLWALPLFTAHYFNEILVMFYGGILLFLACIEFGEALQTGQTKVRKCIGVILVLSTLWVLFVHQPWQIWNRLVHIEEAGAVFQTSSYSCVPASVANLMKHHGFIAKERELAKSMKTTMVGTHMSSALYVLKDLGFHGRRMNVEVETLKSSNATLLTVDHPATGPNSHMIFCKGYEGQRFVVIDPLKGWTFYSPGELEKIWHGETFLFDQNNVVHTNY